MRFLLPAKRRTKVPALRWRPAALAPIHLCGARDSVQVSVPIIRGSRHPIALHDLASATPLAATESARERSPKRISRCIARAKSAISHNTPHFHPFGMRPFPEPMKTPVPWQKERKSLKIRKTQIRSKKRRSGLTLRLVVERYVAIGWTRHRVRGKLFNAVGAWRAPVFPFIGEIGNERKRRCYPSKFECSVGLPCLP